VPVAQPAKARLYAVRELCSRGETFPPGRSDLRAATHARWMPSAATAGSSDNGRGGGIEQHVDALKPEPTVNPEVAGSSPVEPANQSSGEKGAVALSPPSTRDLAGFYLRARLAIIARDRTITVSRGPRSRTVDTSGARKAGGASGAPPPGRAAVCTYRSLRGCRTCRSLPRSAASPSPCPAAA
jgi:hypothetical protein